MKRILALALALLVAAPVFATPFWKTKKFWLTLGLSEGVAVTEIYSARACRHENGIAPCQGGYGEIRARNAVNLVGAAGFPMLTVWGEHMGVNDKIAILPTVGYGAWNTYEAVHQRLISCPKGEHFLYGTKYNCVPNYTEESGW